MEPVSTLLPFAVRRLLRMGEMSQGKLEFAWRAAVGPAIERVTEVRLTPEGTIEVRVTDPAWRRELRHSQGTMLGRVQELLGGDAVKAMRIVTRAERRG